MNWKLVKVFKWAKLQIGYLLTFFFIFFWRDFIFKKTVFNCISICFLLLVSVTGNCYYVTVIFFFRECIVNGKAVNANS